MLDYLDFTVNTSLELRWRQTVTPHHCIECIYGCLNPGYCKRNLELCFIGKQDGVKGLPKVREINKVARLRVVRRQLYG